MKWRSLEESQRQSGTYVSLKKVLAERQAEIEKYVPAETLAVHARATEQLKASGIVGRVVQPGAQVVPFTLPDQDGKPVSSTELLTKGPLVVVFFRGRWCPFCVGQLEALDEYLPRIQEAGASVVGVSPQTVKQGFFMRDQHQLRFALLSDSGNQLARQFGIVYRVPEEQQKIYARTFVNLPFLNGDASWELVVPATFILGAGHRVVYATVSADYRERPEPVDLLKILGAK